MFQDVLRAYMGKKIGIWCVRYTYRGVVKEVGEDYLILSSAYMIEVSGTADKDKPEREDALPNDLIIPFQAIENIMRPQWVNAA